MEFAILPSWAATLPPIINTQEVSTRNQFTYVPAALSKRINKVGAMSAALAALHPLDFKPDGKLDFSAAYGSYNSTHAAAVGAYYRPNENMMLSIGSSFGNGEAMTNAGFSFKPGAGKNHTAMSMAEMAAEIKKLREEIAEQAARINQRAAVIHTLSTEQALAPAMTTNTAASSTDDGGRKGSALPLEGRAPAHNNQ